MAQAQRMNDDIFPTGRHFLHLDTVESAWITSKYPTRPDGTAEVFYWKFTSKTKDEFGQPLTFRHMTDAKITPKNKTTALWLQMVPTTNGKPTTFDDIDGDTTPLEGKWYAANITHGLKGDRTYANIAFIEPYVPKGQQAAAQSARPAATTRPQRPAVEEPPATDMMNTPDEDGPEPDGEEDDPFSEE